MVIMLFIPRTGVIKPIYFHKKVIKLLIYRLPFFYKGSVTMQKLRIQLRAGVLV